MSLRLVKTLWGVEEPISPALFRSIASEGYSGVEVIALAWNTDEAQRILVQSANEASLAVVCQIHTSGGYLSDATGEYVYVGSARCDDHITDLEQQVAACCNLLGQVQNDGFINVHAGVDAWTMEESIQFLTFASHLAAKSPFKVVIETHRQRLFGSPFATRDILSRPEIAQLKGLRLNADLSHWFVACERVFDPSEARDAEWWPKLLKSVAERCDYVHGRLGFAQGPQIADPSAKEYNRDVQLQLNNWVQMWKHQIANGATECWCSPELGPQPYMPSMPHTQKDVASLPEAVLWTKKTIEESFAKEIGEACIR